MNKARTASLAYWCMLAACCGGLLALTGCGNSAEGIAVDDDDLGGIVTGPSGPEAGVWVIAETTDLPTTLA